VTTHPVIEEVAREQNHCGEGPLWDAAQGRLHSILPETWVARSTASVWKSRAARNTTPISTLEKFYEKTQ
jgi:sugar lactone lactonase YvrE